MRRFGLIGYPLGHSFSKKYFTEKFEKEHIADCSYENYPIPSIEQLTGILTNTELEGFNITIPYKELVLPFTHGRTEAVEKIGACNCIKIEQGRLYAHNTDVTGFETSFCKKLQSHHTHALILGTGGASKAIAYVLQRSGITYKQVSRQKNGENTISYQDIPKYIKQYTVLINTTPVGTFPDVASAPDIPYSELTTNHYLFDVVYNPAKSLFLQQGEAMGATIQNGYEMLVVQAEESWRIWNS